MKYKSGKEEWNLDSEQSQSDPIIDPGVGKVRVIRQFSLKIPPGKPKPTKEEALRSSLRMIKDNAFRGGWTFDKDPEVRELNDGFIFTVILREGIVKAADYWGTPGNAGELLNKANKDFQKIEQAKKRLQ